MEKCIWVGAVAYDPKVVTIWEGIARYFNEDAGLPVKVVLFQDYAQQVESLLAPAVSLVPHIDIAWNTNLAFVQSTRWSAAACNPVAMRDTDLEWRTLIIAPTGSPVSAIDALKGRSLALGSRDSGHAAILPVHFLERAGLLEGRDYTAVRFNTDLGKHGDTGTSEVEVLKAVLDGRAEAGAIGSPFWTAVQQQRLAPEGALSVVWTSPSYSHCMFTARPGLDPSLANDFAAALFQMSYDRPSHRVILDMEGLKAWVAPQTSGYESLVDACQRQGFFERTSSG